MAPPNAHPESRQTIQMEKSATAANVRCRGDIGEGTIARDEVQPGYNKGVPDRVVREPSGSMVAVAGTVAENHAGTICRTRRKD